MTTDVRAQGTGTNRVAAIFQNQLTLVESDAVSLAEAMPADRYDFRPTGGEFTGVRTFATSADGTARAITVSNPVGSMS